jgi:transposase
VSNQKFTKEFKAEAVRLVLNGQTQTEVAKKLGVSMHSVHKWVHEYEKKGKEAFPGKGKLSATDEKIRQLEKELREMTMERDILKKAIAYFAKEPK